ncbi:hypothetical protein [Sulfuricurvum sp.]|uniref:hypothetical protein n=1 Tax=Sulfuricurvum sp. TaxID=2025608 RepID=UPI003BB6CEA4
MAIIDIFFWIIYEFGLFSIIYLIYNHKHNDRKITLVILLSLVVGIIEIDSWFLDILSAILSVLLIYYALKVSKQKNELYPLKYLLFGFIILILINITYYVAVG